MNSFINDIRRRILDFSLLSELLERAEKHLIEIFGEGNYTDDHIEVIFRHLQYEYALYEGDISFIGEPLVIKAIPLYCIDKKEDYSYWIGLKGEEKYLYIVDDEQGEGILENQYCFYGFIEDDEGGTETPWDYSSIPLGDLYKVSDFFVEYLG